MIYKIIYEVVLLVTGLIICFCGKRVFKILQMILCGSIGGYIGLMLEEKTGNIWFFYVAIVLMMVGVFLGFKYYKVPLGLTTALTTFTVVFSYFWRSALEAYRTGVGEIGNSGALVIDFLTNTKSLNDIGPGLQEIITNQTEIITSVFNNVATIVERGILISVLAAVVISVLVYIIGDIIIEGITAGLGALILVNLADSIVSIPDVVYIITLAVLAVIGIIGQNYLEKQ